MVTTIGRELEGELLSAARTGQGIALDVLRPLVETVHYVIPAMPVVCVPVAGLLPTAHEAVAGRYGLAEALPADQRRLRRGDHSNGSAAARQDGGPGA